MAHLAASDRCRWRQRQPGSPAARQAGLAATCNLVHDPKCADADIAELRDIHRAIDVAVVRACGWTGLLDAGLDHGFLDTVLTWRRGCRDPRVFGSRFPYSNGKQITPSGCPPAMQSLPRGSAVLSGSRIGGCFCLGTVFVVAEHIPYEAFRVCTIESLAACGPAMTGLP